MALAENYSLGKRRFNEDTNTPIREICKRFRPIDISSTQSKSVLSEDGEIIANYILLIERLNNLETTNASLEAKITTLMKNASTLEDKYKEQNITLKKYIDTSTDITKLASESRDLIQKMELLTDKCKAVLAENEVLKTDIKYLERACDKSADYYRTCFT